MNSRLGVNSNCIENWQKTCEKVLRKFDKVIVPSENTKKLYNEVYSDLKIDVVEHGVDIINIQSNKKEKNTDVFNIAFVGAMAIHKGSNVLKDLIKSSTDSKLKIHLFGKPNDAFLEKNRGNYINHGKYERGQLPQLLVDNNIDLVCIFATWPETYSYTLTECYMAGVPILTFNIGAVGDRIQNDKLGWIIDINTKTSEILNKIKEIHKNVDEYKKIKNNFKNYAFKSLGEMQEYYENLYNSITKVNKKLNLYSFMNYRIKTKEIEFSEHIQNYGHVIYKYEKIRSTKIWKIAKKIKRIIKRK